MVIIFSFVCPVENTRNKIGSNKHKMSYFFIPGIKVNFFYCIKNLSKDCGNVNPFEFGGLFSIFLEGLNELITPKIYFILGQDLIFFYNN